MAERLSEFGLIAKHFMPLATHPGALALSDDACVLKQEAACDLVVTADALTAGVHFLPDDPPNLIASKALRVNLSDLAAKGAEPVGYLLALALPHSLRDDWLAEFARGLDDDQKAFGVSLLGGDTTATPGPLTIAITALGRVPRGAMIRRSGARLGDHVFVSGTIGDAGAGLALLQGAVGGVADAAFLVGRYRQPTPRLRLGLALRDVATAALDVSDGLVADLGHIAEVSGVRIVINAHAVPQSTALAGLTLPNYGLAEVLAAGDDYEIAFTARSLGAVEAAARAAGVAVARIGLVEAGAGVVVKDRDGRDFPITKAGFTHF